MKNSEAQYAPPSSRAAFHNSSQKFVETPRNLDTTISNQRYGVSLKKGNFRKTQEDRVRIIYS